MTQTRNEIMNSPLEFVGGNRLSDLDNLPTLKRIEHCRKARLKRQALAAKNRRDEVVTKFKQIPVLSEAQRAARQRERVILDHEERNRKILLQASVEREKKIKAQQMKLVLASLSKFFKALRHEEQKTRLSIILLEILYKYRHLRITEQDLKDPKKRSIRYVVPRHEFFYRAHMETNKSYSEIARFVCRHDHTTAYSGIRRYKQFQRMKAGLEPRCSSKINFDLIIPMKGLAQ